MFPNLAERVKTEFWSLSQDKLARVFFYLLILFLPTQLGKHFWPNFSFVYGIRLDYLSPTIYFTDVVLVLVIVFSFKKTIRELAKSKYLKLFLLYLLALLISSFLAKNIYASFLGIVKFLEYFYLFSYVVLNYKKLNKEVLFSFLFVGIFFESLLSFLQVFNNGSLGGALYYLGERTFTSQTPGIANASINGGLYLRPYGTFPHPNVLSFYFISATLLMLNYFKKKKYQTILIFLSLIISTFTIFLTLGRISVFAWIFDLIIIFFYLTKNRYKFVNKKNSILFFLPLFLLIIFIFQKNIYFLRLESVSFVDESFVQRIWLMDQTVNIIRNNFLFGVGINNFYYYLSPYLQSSKIFFVQPVHNIYLLIFSETGLIGFLFFVYFCFGLLKKTFYKNRKIKPYILMLLITTFFLGFFDHYLLTIQQGQILFAIIFGISASE